MVPAHTGILFTDNFTNFVMNIYFLFHIMVIYGKIWDLIMIFSLIFKWLWISYFFILIVRFFALKRIKKDEVKDIGADVAAISKTEDDDGCGSAEPTQV